MSIFAFIVLVIAAIVALVQSPKPWWLVPGLIVTGTVLALVVTSGTIVQLH